jgi:hypothetical protein
MDLEIRRRKAVDAGATKRFAGPSFLDLEDKTMGEPEVLGTKKAQGTRLAARRRRRTFDSCLSRPRHRPGPFVAPLGLARHSIPTRDEALRPGRERNLT